MSTEVKTEKPKVKINPNDVLKMLAEGKKRNEIGEFYGLNKRQTKLMFMHPKLKGRKTHFTRSGEKLVSFEYDESADDSDVKEVELGAKSTGEPNPETSTTNQEGW